MFADKVNFNEVEREDGLGHVYSYENELIYTGLQKGLSKGRDEKAIEVAQNLHKMGLSSEQVAEGTGLSLEEVIQIKEQMQ